MPTFENYGAGESKDEAERLYKNDISPEKFSTKQFRTAAELPENTGLYGEENDLSAEEKIYEELDNTATAEKDLIALGKRCDDYLNNKGELPADLTEEEAEKLALIYRESLNKEDKKSRTSKESHAPEPVRTRHTEFVNLRRGRIAHATPDPNEKVKLDRKSNADYLSKKAKTAA